MALPQYWLIRSMLLSTKTNMNKGDRLPSPGNLTPILFSLATTALLGWGLMSSQQRYISADTGLGYVLGIVGASLMVLLLLYPLRKRWLAMRHLPATKHWFRLHMLFGILGPTAILFHCNFEVGALNSRVALYCMLLVVASGIIGRYIYVKLHAGLYGQRLSSQDLLRLAQDQKQTLADAFGSNAELQEKLDHLFNVMVPDDPTQISVTTALMAAPRRHRQLKAFERAITQTADARLIAIWKQDHRVLKDYLHTLRRLAQLQFFDRMFHWWHVLHLPIFIMMLLTMSIHIWAVHAY